MAAGARASWLTPRRRRYAATGGTAAEQAQVIAQAQALAQAQAQAQGGHQSAYASYTRGPSPQGAREVGAGIRGGAKPARPSRAPGPRTRSPANVQYARYGLR